MDAAGFGFLFVHFVEAAGGGGEHVFFSLSDGDDPTRWRRLNGGRPVLTTELGSGAARDPFIVRGDTGFHIVASDLRVWGEHAVDWDGWQRTGSRSIHVWHSADLVAWSPPELVEVAPPEAGMAWAPEVLRDGGEYLVYWSSTLYPAADPEHAGPSYSRILVSRTTDFRSFSPAEVLIDHGHSVIDASIYRVGGQVVRFAKADDSVAGSAKVFQEVGSSFFAADFRTVHTRIGDERYPRVEAPLLFEHPRAGLWYLLVDQYAQQPMGYIAYTSPDPLSGDWTAVPEPDFDIPPNTKHGGVLPLVGDEWQRLDAAF